MKSGLLFGTACSLDGLIDRIQAELGEPCTVVATGGLATVIVPLCKHPMILDDDARYIAYILEDKVKKEVIVFAITSISLVI